METFPDCNGLGDTPFNENAVLPNEMSRPLTKQASRETVPGFIKIGAQAERSFVVAFVMSISIGLGKTVQLSRAIGLSNWTSPTWFE